MKDAELRRTFPFGAREGNERLDVTVRTCSIVGTGIAANAMARALSNAGVGVKGIAGRDAQKTAALAESIGAQTYSLDDIAVDIDLLLVCVTDSAIVDVANILSARRDLTGVLVSHMAGAYPVSLLDPVQVSGARLGKMHPIASLAGGLKIPRVMWGVEGDDCVFPRLSSLVRALGGVPIDLRGVDLELYHLSAVFASNFLIGTIGAAVDLWRRSHAPAVPAEALVPLAKSVVANWENLGLERALTGPIARGDLKAVMAQLRRVAAEDDRLEALYRALALATADIAGRRPDSEGAAIAEIVSSLAETKVIH